MDKCILDDILSQLFSMSLRKLMPWIILGIFSCLSMWLISLLHKFTIGPCMDQWYHLWGDAPSYRWVVLNKTRVWRAKIWGFEILVEFSFLSITLVNVRIDWLNWLLILILVIGLLVILIGCKIFLSWWCQRCLC